MKFLFSLLGLVGITSMVFAQDTLTVNILPQAEFTYIVKNDSTSNYSITPASNAHQMWDFSNLQNHFQKVPTYDSTSKTAYQNEFPTSNIYTYGPAAFYSGLFGSAPVGTQGMNKGYMFWRTETTGFWVEGFLSESGIYAGKPVHYQNSELLLPLPGFLNNTASNQSRWTLSMDANPLDIDTFYVSNTMKEFVYDAYGSLKTPILDTTEVLRLHEYTIKTDSVYALLNGNQVYAMELMRDTTNTYYYLSKDYSYPVLTTYANKHNMVKFTEYYNSKMPNTSMAVSNIIPNLTLKAYPNPTDNELTLETSQSYQGIISVVTLTGETVKEQLMNSSQLTFSMEDLRSGVYFVVLKSTSGQVLNQLKVMKL